MRPVYLIEGTGFQNLIKTIEPRWKMPTRKTITN